MKIPPIRKMLTTHKSGCSIRRFSDGLDRKCSCGRDQAEKDYNDIMEILQNILDFDLISTDARKDTIQKILSADTKILSRS